MNILLNKLTIVLTCSFLILGCKKDTVEVITINSSEKFIGSWDNINAYSNSVIRIVITKKAEHLLSIKLWKSCKPKSCYLGVNEVNTKELNDGVLPVEITWNNQPVSLRLGLTKEGQLVLRDPSSQAGDFEIQYFSRVPTLTFFQQVSLEDALNANLLRHTINGSHQNNNQLTPGTIVVYQTSEGRYGKFQVRGNDSILTMRWATWNDDGSQYEGADYLAINSNRPFDLDVGKEDLSPKKIQSDFFWEDSGKTDRRLIPENNATFAVFNLE